MSTRAQIEANRRNANKSTGPRTEAGKAASRLNALKSGIEAKSTVIPGESAAELEALTASYHDRFRPAAPEEVFLVDVLVSSDWLLRRLRKVEAQLWQNAVEDDRRFSDQNAKWQLGRIFSRKNNDLTRLQRRIDSATRAYHRALDRLEQQQSERPNPEPPSPKLASFRKSTTNDDPNQQQPPRAEGCDPEPPGPRAPAHAAGVRLRTRDYGSRNFQRCAIF